MPPCGSEEYDAEGVRIRHCCECGHGQVYCGLCGKTHTTDEGRAQFVEKALRKVRWPWEMLKTLRDEGWMVAVHNDYRLNGKTMTFWLFTRADGRWIKGEGETDAEALSQTLASRPAHEMEPLKGSKPPATDTHEQSSLAPTQEESSS